MCSKGTMLLVVASLSFLTYSFSFFHPVGRRLVRRRLALGSTHQGTPEIEMAP